MNKVLRGRGARSFKFEENWLMLDECEKVVEEAWVGGGRLESALVTIKEKKKKRMWGWFQCLGLIKDAT